MGRTFRVAGWILLAGMLAGLLSVAPNFYGLLGLAATFALVLLAAGLVWLILLGLSRLDGGTRWGLLLLIVPLVPLAFNAQVFVALYLTLVVCLAFIAVGLRRMNRNKMATGVLALLVGGLPLLALSIVLTLDGWQADEALAWPAVHNDARLDAPDPSLPGPYAVLTRSYGSGSDPRRPEFGADADWASVAVDGSKLLDGWDGLAGWSRSAYWGAAADALPVQARVWLPDGQGPFPLVLVVHGNHEMSDFSDGGYAYLGELFASRGYIVVSVDENFLNSGLSNLIGGPTAQLEEESDARAWLLLEHLAQWRQWTADPGHPMYGKADLGAVVLIGHSRGGEAVTEAALFNRLDRYPDDGTLAFDYGFGIRGVIAIAPVDHQYNPRDRDTVLRGVSYLVIHGSHDADVDAYAGSALYSRLSFARCEHCFKVGVYLLGANHGQFNTSWGAFDAAGPFGRLINTGTLMPGPEQRQVARVLFSAFLDAVVKGDDGYRRFLAQPELGSHWLPAAARYLNAYRDARQVVLADFEEDADLATAGDAGSVRTAGLSLWREAEVPLRWRDMDSAAVLIGWNGSDDAAPVYEIALPGSNWLRPEMTLAFAAAMGTEAPEGVDDFGVPEALDFEIELEDRAGNRATLELSARRPLYPQVDPVMYKLELLDGGPASEVVFQRYAFSLSEWRQQNPALDISSLAALRFRFPADTPASVWLDDVLVSPDGY